MDMVGHQHIGVDVASMFFRRFLKFFKVETVVFFGPKNDLSIIATLDDVLRLTGNDEAGKACHKACYLLSLSVDVRNNSTTVCLYQGV